MKRVMLELNLPDDLAQRAEAAGLLTPETIEEFLQEEIRRRAVDYLLSIAPQLEGAGVEPMTEEEVQAEIDADRTEQRRNTCRS